MSNIHNKAKSICNQILKFQKIVSVYPQYFFKSRLCLLNFTLNYHQKQVPIENQSHSNYKLLLSFQQSV
jgi:hypothetical protein